VIDPSPVVSLGATFGTSECTGSPLAREPFVQRFTVVVCEIEHLCEDALLESVTFLRRGDDRAVFVEDLPEVNIGQPNVVPTFSTL
jgi:hypothetical protein